MLSNRIQSGWTQRNSQRFIPGAEPITLETRQLLATTVIPLPGEGIGATTLLNNSGDIVSRLSGVPGESKYDNTYFLYRIGSTPVPIGYPAGAAPSPDQPLDVEVAALNDAGQVIGTVSGFLGPIHGFNFSRQIGAVLIPTLPGGYTSSEPTALSARGLVAGVDFKSEPPDPILGTGIPDFNTMRGFLYGQKLGLVDLGTLPGLPSLTPSNVNDASGLVVGIAAAPLGSAGPIPTEHAFLYSIRRRTAKDLGTTPGFDLSAAQFVNDRGQVVGVLGNSSNPNASHVFFYDSATGLKDVGTLPGFDTMTPVALEKSGRVIILATNSQFQPVAPRAVEYIPHFGLKDLGALPNMSTTFGPEPGTVRLTPPNKYGQALVTVEGGVGDTIVYLDDLNTGRLIDLSSMLKVQLISADNTTRITDAGRFFVTGIGGSSDPNLIGTTFLATLDPTDFPAPQSDLAIAITGLPATTQRGDVVTATITITNNGPDLAKNVRLLGTFGRGLMPLSTAGPGTRSATRHGILVNLRRLPNGASVTFIVKLRASHTGLTTLDVTVLASHDANLANNTAVASMTVKT